MDIRLLGIPLQDGARRLGCKMGPDAYRTAGLHETLQQLGHNVHDSGDMTAHENQNLTHPNQALYHLPEMCSWIGPIAERAYQERQQGFPIFMGGDHAMSAGTVAGMQNHAKEIGRPLFVLWLDAHTDFHTLDSTDSGNLHGTPVAYFSGREGFEGYYPALKSAVPFDNICLFGIRSVDTPEYNALKKTAITVYNMHDIDEFGVHNLLRRFLQHVKQANGLLHVSFDVDFLEPSIAPAVGTTVPGGATLREAHSVMKLLGDSHLVSSLDLVELNPFLDERGKTATLMTALVAELMRQR